MWTVVIEWTGGFLARTCIKNESERKWGASETILEVNGSHRPAADLTQLDRRINRWSESDTDIWMEALWELTQGDRTPCKSQWYPRSFLSTIQAPHKKKRWSGFPFRQTPQKWSTKQNVMDSNKWPCFILIFVPNESTAGSHRSNLSPAWKSLLGTAARIDKWIWISISRRQIAFDSWSMNHADCQMTLKKDM